MDCIDLDSPEIKICGKIDEKNHFNLMDFVDSENLSFAINTTPWEEKNSSTSLLGVHKVNNKILSGPVEKYSALGFYTNEEGKIRVKIIENQNSENLESCFSAFGGYYTILQDSNIIEYNEYHHSRSACGTDSSGRYLYFFICTSNLISDESGMTYQECAQILLEHGCTDALQFDGGHSSAMFTPKINYKHAKLNKKIPAAFGICFRANAL